MCVPENQVVLLCSFDDTATGGSIRTYRCSPDGILEEVASTPSPAVSFLTHHPTKPVIYSVNRVNDGEIRTYAYDDSTGTIELIDSHSSMGTDPCYVSVDATASVVFIANYTGPNIAMYRLQPDGTIADNATTIEHQGSSIHEERQQTPHPHSIRPDPANRVVFVPDLGTDNVHSYAFDHQQGAIEPADQPFVKIAPGAGPRHLAFNPRQPYCYVINELNATITTLSYDPSSSRITPEETTSTLPDGFTGHRQAADIHVHPTGDYLYASNRGHDSIAIFEINQQTGQIEQLAFESTRGEWPRNFVIDPTGTYLFVENRHSDSVISYRINLETGRLDPIDHPLKVPEPVCMKFLPAYD